MRIKKIFQSIVTNIRQKHTRKDLQKGFTLIELLVVIAIVALLSSVIMAGLQSARSNARDSKRVQEMRTVEKALSLYALDNGGYIPKSNYTTINGVGANVVPKNADGTINCALNQENNDTLYEILIPDYLAAKPSIDPLEDLGYCYVYVSGGDVVYTAGAEYDASGKLTSPKVLLATIDGNTKNKASVFFAASENTVTNSGNKALVGISFGVIPPVQLNVDLTTGIRSNTAYDQEIPGDNTGGTGGEDLMCGDNAINNDGVCECPEGSNMIDGNCVVDTLVCPLNENSDTGFCECDSGYTRDEGGTCQMDILECGENQHDDGYGACACDEYYGWDEESGACLYVPATCQQFAEDDGSMTQTCACISGFHDEGGECVQDLICGANRYDNGSGTCVCNEGYVPDQSGDGCHYPPSCGAYEEEDGYGNCGCISGYAYNSGGQCELIVVTCGENEINMSDVCVCVDGYVRNDSGSCVEDVLICPENKHASEGVCVCNDGYISNGDSCEVVLMCGENAHQVGGGCACNEGYEGDGTSCTMIPQCGSNQHAENGFCVCNEGYSFIDGSCQIPQDPPSCEEGYTWNSSSMSCEPNSYWGW